MVSRNTELAQFLSAMRARLSPCDVGLPDGTGRRRLPGLRRQEVAQLAAVSIDWYIRLEQGRVGTPGAAVLDAVAGALRLSDPERRHLHLIARAETPPASHRPAPVSRSVLTLLAGMPLLPAYVLDFRFDVLARNEAAVALFGADFVPGANVARLLFLHPGVRGMQRDWARIARETAGNLRANQARRRDDPRLRDLVTELCRDSPEFAGWWRHQTVQERTSGRKRLRHPTGGDLTVCYDALSTMDNSDHSLLVITPADPAAEQVLRGIVIQHSRALASTGQGHEDRAGAVVSGR